MMKGLSYWEIASHPLLWLIFGAVVLLVMLQCVGFLKKGLKRAKELGFTNAELKKIVRSSCSVSILPIIPIVAVLIALMPSLGGPLPWYRISVIGSAAFESFMASMAADAMGETLSAAGMSPEAFGAALLVMSFGGTCYAFWAVLGLKPVSKVYDRLRKGTAALIAMISSCCLGGVVSAIASNYYDSTDVSLWVFLIAAATTFLLMLIGKKVPKLKKLDANASGIATLVGMLAAVLICL